MKMPRLLAALSHGRRNPQHKQLGFFATLTLLSQVVCAMLTQFSRSANKKAP
jgi:hypothetical protein